MSSYININLVNVSLVINGLLGGKRYEMFSSRCYREQWTFAMWVLDAVFGKDHCLECYRFELDNFDGIQD